MSKLKISVIVPIYNTEDYLEETLRSVEQQTLGMGNIELILVDDGSSDGSADICERFQRKYPENVKFLQQENAGVSVARNNALEYATCPIVTFLDSDDYWSPNAFKFAVKFFSDDECTVDLLVGKTELFEDAKGDHPLDARFKKSRYIFLDETPCDIQSIMGNCFFRREAISDLRFAEDVSTSEDTLFIVQVLLRKCVYYAAKECVYYHRVRAAGSSLSQVDTWEKHMQNLVVCNRMYQASLDALGCIHPLAQASALYILTWQLFAKQAAPYTSEQSDAWRKEFAHILDKVDLRIICESRWTTGTKKAFMCRMKYGNDFFDQMVWVKGRVGSYRGQKVTTLNQAGCCKIYQIKKRGERLCVEGTTNMAMFALPFEMFVEDRTASELYPCDMVPYPTGSQRTLAGDIAYEGMRFVVDLPLRPGSTYSFKVRFSEERELLQLRPRFGETGLFYYESSCDYHVFGDVMVKHIDNELRLYSSSARMVAASEARRLREVWSDADLDRKDRMRFCAMRVAYHARRLFLRKPIWLFSDKEWKAGDNAETVYRYAVKHGGRDVHMYFALQKDSPDYNEVNSYGRVLEPGSFKFELNFLLSSILISSRSERGLVNPFGDDQKYVRDLLDYDFIYLTHGTLFGDLASMLSKPVKRISLFSVGTQMERNALLAEAYGYGDSEVELLGMPRYDCYGTRPRKKLIAFLPTWRSHLAGAVIPGTTTREYVDDFGSTDFCKFYNGLINDERLLSAMKQYGYVGEFFLHPAFVRQTGDFDGNDVIIVGDGSADYERLLDEASLLVTDYSGVGFDFGYQRKPVVYTQYDAIFEGGHTYGAESYYDYETEGFGPIATTIEDAVDDIIEYMQQDCTIGSDYEKRADAMFGFSDRESSRRVFEAAMKIESQRKADGLDK